MEDADVDCRGAAGRHNEKECDRHMMAVKDALYVLNGKWKLSIILALTFDNYRFKELGRKVGVSPKMLSKELKELEMNQLITRTVWDTKPVTVEYAITPYGRTLKKLIRELGDWGEKHRKKIMTAQNA
jgi:DNA-binding HxlR family transcriptional regulator